MVVLSVGISLTLWYFWGRNIRYHGLSPDIKQEQAFLSSTPSGKKVLKNKDTAELPHGQKNLPVFKKPGDYFITSIYNLMSYELKKRFWGWRPNDIICGKLKLTDNVNNFQLGVLEVVRITTKAAVDNFTRFEDTDGYNDDLKTAYELFMTSPNALWLPTAEVKYQDALDHLENFIKCLSKGECRFYANSESILYLLESYQYLLLTCNNDLIKASEPDGTKVSFIKADNYYYFTKGVIYALIVMFESLQKDMTAQVEVIDPDKIIQKIIKQLSGADARDPWIVLNSAPDSLMANHRANLSITINSVYHLLRKILIKNKLYELMNN